jgi:UDP-N-acetyl-D-mannosaminuronate dehydrogenase
MGINHTLKVMENDIKKANHLSFAPNVEHLRETQAFIVTVLLLLDRAHRPDLISLIKPSETADWLLKVSDVEV